MAVGGGLLCTSANTTSSPLILDPFDPNNWEPDTHEYHIYADDMAQLWAVVDEVDYAWAIQWRWHPVRTHGGRIYLRRAVTEYSNGTRLRNITLYLHVEIHKRIGVQPPTDRHTLVDHRDGDGLNCRRLNLRWATRAFNRRNVNGCLQYDNE